MVSSAHNWYQTPPPTEFAAGIDCRNGEKGPDPRRRPPPQNYKPGSSAAWSRMYFVRIGFPGHSTSNSTSAPGRWQSCSASMAKLLLQVAHLGRLPTNHTSLNPARARAWTSRKLGRGPPCFKAGLAAIDVKETSPKELSELAPLGSQLETAHSVTATRQLGGFCPCAASQRQRSSAICNP